MKEKQSMRKLLKEAVTEKLQKCNVGQVMRRSDLRRSILKDPEVVQPIISFLMRKKKKYCPETALRRIDRMFADVLESLEFIDIRYDLKKHHTWIVKICEVEDDGEK
jgi:hypothetical protein